MLIMVGIDLGSQNGPMEPRSWIVRGRADSSSWFDHAYVGLEAAHLGQVPPGSAEEEIRDAVERGYEHQDYETRKQLVRDYSAFLSRMRPGEYVVTQHRDEVHIGRIIGKAVYADPPYRLRRDVEWLRVVPPSDELDPFLQQQGRVVDITDATALLERLLQSSPPTVERLGFPPLTQEFADSLYMPLASLQRIADLLLARRQIVLYGPPGTGKTYVAMSLAEYLVSDASNVQLVQFHPSYSYEDFFEGYRPTERGTFALTAGPLRRIANEARDNPGEPYILIIDELNRANIAKVFGELYFLLEYRRKKVRLQYSDDLFDLPPNLFLIGTMNTADRSIALLDAAMRRRFSFLELHPDTDPVRGVLARRYGPDDRRTRLLAALNEKLEDRDLRIGPSYLMREDDLERIWEYDILPLLQEHYYGRLDHDEVRARFGLEALLRDHAD